MSYSLSNRRDVLQVSIFKVEKIGISHGVNDKIGPMLFDRCANFCMFYFLLRYARGQSNQRKHI